MANWSGLGVVFAFCACGLLAAVVLVWLAIRWARMKSREPNPLDSHLERLRLKRRQRVSRDRQGWKDQQKIRRDPKSTGCVK